VRILVLQFVSAVRGRPAPRFDPQLGVLLTLLRQRYHEVALTGVARFDVNAVKSALARCLPQLIYADIAPVCVDAARRTLQYLQEHEFLPVVAGGQFCTVDPAAGLSLPGVQAVAIGEPDASLVTYLERMKDPAIRQIVRGVWLRDERGLARPELPPLVEDLDSLPLPERDLFDYAQHVARTGEIEIAVGRGCPQQCGYCLNPTFRALYDNRGGWVRRRSPEPIVDEIDALRTRYAGVRSVRFLDHAFTLDDAWLAAMLDRYRNRCDLPFRCHVRANSADAARVMLLAQAGCRMADVEVISASDFIRNEIFAMQLSTDQVHAVFEALRAAGIAARAILYLGSPYESEASLDETRTLLRRIRPVLVDIRPYFPFPGTPAVATCQENGWIHSRGQEQFHSELPGIDMPACRPEIVAAFIRRLRLEFPVELAEPWWRRWSNASRSVLEQFFRKR
jgi:radical SAM superfamily enzyme YgiQ (UPF0313 family)